MSQHNYLVSPTPRSGAPLVVALKNLTAYRHDPPGEESDKPVLPETTAGPPSVPPEKKQENFSDKDSWDEGDVGSEASYVHRSGSEGSSSWNDIDSVSTNGVITAFMKNGNDCVGRDIQPRVP